ncbi:exp1-like protein [Mortierella polycephala]|uniref:Exp1-like protein n=1 Tax=Mortierella polycephala TaxID=41804 RepID=A0A9P6PKR7_9FUNG|nr:exp1-like protein [Mortierella polycephala]
MSALAALRSLSLSSSVFGTQQVRTMATKATAASAASKTIATPKKADTAKAVKAPKAVKAAPVQPKKVDAISMPKRPNTAWTLFYVDHLDKVRATGRKIVPTEETVAASAIWKQLPDAQKKVYEDKHQAEMAEFKAQTEMRLQELTPEQFKIENTRRQALRAAGKKNLPALRDPNAPKRPLTSYFRYIQDLRKTGKYADLPLREQAPAMANDWKNVPQAEKDRYTELSRVANEEYAKVKAAYEASRK